MGQILALPPRTPGFHSQQPWRYQNRTKTPLTPVPPPSLAPIFSSPFPAGVAFIWGGLEGDFPRPSPPPPEEMALVGRNASAKRFREFAHGRACAHAALTTLGVESPGYPHPLLRGVGRAPLWPEGVVGSITHARGLAAAAAASAQIYAGIGLDLERTARLSERLLERTCRPRELAQLNSLASPVRDLLATVIFSAKESIFKALNPATAIFLGFQDAEVEVEPDNLAEPGAGDFLWRLCRDVGAPFPVGFQGAGRFLIHGEWVLTGVWLPHQPPG